MIAEEPLALFRKQQTILAAWSAMLAMTGEYTNRIHAGIAQEDRERIRDCQIPPSHWRIWLAYFPTGDDCDQEYDHSSVDLEDNISQASAANAPLRPNTQTTTFRVGHALIHLMSSSAFSGRREIRRWKWRPAIAAKLHRIWPVTSPSISWPPASALSAIEAHFVANRFFDWLGEVRRRGQ